MWTLPLRAARIPPAAAPLMIEFHGSSFLRMWTNVQSIVLNRPPHTAKLPAMIGDLCFTVAKHPICKQNQKTGYIRLKQFQLAQSIHVPFVDWNQMEHFGILLSLEKHRHQCIPLQMLRHNRQQFCTGKVHVHIPPWCLILSVEPTGMEKEKIDFNLVWGKWGKKENKLYDWNESIDIDIVSEQMKRIRIRSVQK